MFKNFRFDFPNRLMENAFFLKKLLVLNISLVFVLLSLTINDCLSFYNTRSRSRDPVEIKKIGICCLKIS